MFVLLFRFVSLFDTHVLCSLYLILPACQWLAPFAADV